MPDGLGCVLSDIPQVVGVIPADHKTLLTARAAMLAEVFADDNELGEEFSQICGNHTDYLWNIVHETP